MIRQRLSKRNLAIVAAGGLIAGFGVAYAFLALSTANQPGAAKLPSAPPLLPSTGTSSGAAQTAYSPTDPSGTWVLASDGVNFVGYRARELLAVDFVASPNEAVGRTTDLKGSLRIASGQLTSVEITANVAGLRSDEELRDQHVSEGLELSKYPEATFKLTQSIDVSQANQGVVKHVSAEGELTIHGQTKAETIPMDVRWDGSSIAVAGSIVIHRADFGLEMPNLLVFRVADDVTIEFQLAFRPTCAPSCVANASPPPPLVSPSAPAEPSASPPGAGTGSLASTSGRLAFAGVTNQGENAPSIAEIYTVGADGKALTQVTKQGKFAETPAWSSNGKYIAYTSRSDESEYGLWVVPSSGGTPRQVTDHAARRPSWSPDGSRIAFVDVAESGSGLFIVNADGSNLHQVNLPAGSANDPAWSPDGRTLLFAFFAADGNHESVYAAGPDGSNPRPLIDAGTYSYAPSWSPDGKEIVFVEDGNVAITASNGSHAQLLTRGRSVDRPRLSPDGSRIAFTQNDGIWIMNRDGSAATLLSLDLDFAGFAAWRP